MDTKRFELLQLIERRRKWPAELKARIMEEALAPASR
jgi:transposase-like protein